MSGWGLFFRAKEYNTRYFCITRSKVRRLQVTTVLRKTISQKKIPTKPGNGLIFKGLLLRSYGRISGCYSERACQTLRNKTIGNRAYRYRLERISRDRVCIALLPGSSGLAGLFKTASNLCVACGLIFKGLIGCFSMITHIQPCGVNP
jgi:hypothetical protein